MGLFGSIKKAVSSVGNSVKKAASSVKNTVTKTASKVVKPATKAVSQVVKTAGKVVPTLYNDAKSAAVGMATLPTQTLTKGISSLGSATSQVASSLTLPLMAAVGVAVLFLLKK